MSNRHHQPDTSSAFVGGFFTGLGTGLGLACIAIVLAKLVGAFP